MEFRVGLHGKYTVGYKGVENHMQNKKENEMEATI